MSRKAGRYFKEAPSRSHPSHSTTQYSPYLTNSNPCEGFANGEDLRIESPTDFKHVIGISNETFLAIKSAEKELFVGMSHSQESLEDAMDLLGQSLNGNKPRLTVVQEREMHGGAFLLRTVEIIKHSDENIGIIIRLGNELDRWDGVFISQLVLGSMVETSGLIKLGDEILYVNGVDISGKDLDEVTLLLKIPSRLLITLKIRQVGKCAYRTRESRSASSSPRRFQSGRRTELMLGDYKSKTIPRPSSAQKHRDASGGKVSSTARQDSQDYHNNNCSVNNAQPPQGGAKAASRSRFRSATASEVLSGGSSSELSPRDTSTSERDLSPTFGPEICIAPDDDSDSVVFVDEETDAKNGSFNDFDGLRNSAPAGSTVLRKLTQQSRPKSTVIPPDQTLLEESRREEEAELNLRHVSSSDDIRKDGKHSGKGSDRDIPKMTRQTSIPGESPQSPRRDDQRLIRRKMAGISLDFSLFKMPQSAKINRSNFIGRKGSNPSQSVGQKYVPKPSPEKKKSRRISSNKPLDVDATQFIKYKGDVGTRARSPSPFSGILTLHLHGGRKMSTKKEMRDLYCVVEVDCVHKAQTCTICGHDEFCWDEKFEIDLEQSHCLGLMIYSYGSDSDMKQKLCYRTAVRFSNLFSQMRSKEEVHNLALRLDPRGTLYATLSFTERSATLKRVPSLDRRGVFGVHIDVVVRREGGEKNIPFIVQKCVQEVELRGLNSIGIYRVCGSAKKKKKLHDEFEKASALVDLNFDNYPDINIITGVLKDYLRELPEPLFTSTVCERLLELLDSETMSFSTEMILQAMLLLPTSNKDTAEYLLDHLKAVDAYSGRNKMNMYNIAVCFGPVLMSRGCAQAIANGNEKHKSEGVSRTQSVDSAEKHIELLHTLLDVWPARTVLAKGPPPDEEEPKPSEDPVVIDNQEEDSCYHSNDDLDESAPKDAVVVVGNGGGNEVEVEIKNPVEENAGWDADHLEVSAC